MTRYKVGNVKGKKGEDGKSAYQIALEHEFEGTEEEWLESLKASVPVDDKMSDTSTNPVQNKVVKNYIDEENSMLGGRIAGIGMISDNAQQTANEAKTIAMGSSVGYVFDTEADMYAWLEEPDNISKLKVGNSHFYIRDLNVPDYWWDGTNPQPLETQKVDLSGYVTKEEFQTTVGNIETLLGGI